MGEKTSKDIFSESAQQIHSKTIMHTPRKDLYQSCILKFWIFWQAFFVCLFVCLFVLFCGRLTWESMRNYKMCDILETAGRRAKWTKIWTSGVSM